MCPCRRFIAVAAGLLTGAVYFPPLVHAGDCAVGTDYYRQAENQTSASDRLHYLQLADAECPNFRTAYWLGRTYFELGQAALAVPEYQRAFDLADEQRIQAMVLGRKAQALAATGQDLEAIGALESAREFLGTQPPPEWLLDLQRTLDEKMSSDVLSAAAIGEALDGRNFAVKPRITLWVSFDFDSDRLNRQGSMQVDEMGGALMQNSSVGSTIRIVGHTDRIGDERYNQGLSERRARAVVSTLEARYPQLYGRLIAEGRGEREPRYPGDDDRDHALNRRVEMLVE